jgi:hypothetical protein
MNRSLTLLLEIVNRIETIIQDYTSSVYSTGSVSLETHLEWMSQNQHIETTRPFKTPTSRRWTTLGVDRHLFVMIDRWQEMANMLDWD